MQHLLDFIHEHTLEEQLYLVVAGPAGENEIELIWQSRPTRNHWQMRPNKSGEPWQSVDQSELLATLAARGVDMTSVERELSAVAASQIAFADLVTRDAKTRLGADFVQRVLIGHQAFVSELHATLAQLAGNPRPSLSVVAGGGAQTAARAGHLSVVPVP